MRAIPVSPMKFDEFIKKLLPVFGRDRLSEDIRITRGELTDLIPVYTDAAKFFKNWKYKSEEVISLNAAIRAPAGPKASNPVVLIAELLPQVLDSLVRVEEMIATNLASNVSGKGLTYKQASIIQFIDVVTLISKYARKYLNYVYVYESAQFKESGLEPRDSIPPAETRWIEERAHDFGVALTIAQREPQAVVEAITAIPEIEVANSDFQSLTRTIGPTSLDPLKFGFVAARTNPIYFLRMIVAEYQVARHKEMREELSVLQLRKINLEKLKAGRADANLEKQIVVVESRIQSVSYELSKMAHLES